MSEPYIGEIRMFAGSFAPPGWLVCDGRELPVNAEHAALYEVIGTAYGGNTETFVLPDLRSAVSAELIAGVRVSFIIARCGAKPENLKT